MYSDSRLLHTKFAKINSERPTLSVAQSVKRTSLKNKTKELRSCPRYPSVARPIPSVALSRIDPTAFWVPTKTREHVACSATHKAYGNNALTPGNDVHLLLLLNNDLAIPTLASRVRHGCDDCRTPRMPYGRRVHFTRGKFQSKSARYSIRTRRVMVTGDPLPARRHGPEKRRHSLYTLSTDAASSPNNASPLDSQALYEKSTASWAPGETPFAGETAPADLRSGAA